VSLGCGFVLAAVQKKMKIRVRPMDDAAIVPPNSNNGNRLGSRQCSDKVPIGEARAARDYVAGRLILLEHLRNAMELQ